MKPFAVAALLLLAAVRASAQTPNTCGAGVQNYILVLLSPGSAYVTVSTDSKGIAPVKPATC
jgi:hypothetical protein